MARVEKLVFFGTPSFAVPTLEALCGAKRRPRLVVSQPSRRVGRGRRLMHPPVVTWARERRLPVRQPASVADESFLTALRQIEPDVAVVVAFGQLFPPQLLKLPTQGCINLHASLLPRFRGASPIQAAIAAGATRTGVTSMQMTEGLDSGPILLQAETEIDPREAASDLAERLAVMGGELILETLERLEEGTLRPRDQPEDGVSLAPRLRRADGEIDWRMRSDEISNRIRAFSPWPGSHSTLRREPVKILQALPAEPIERSRTKPGQFLGLRQDQMLVSCGEGTTLAIESLQRPGKRPVRATEFANGERLEVGERFG